MKRTKTSTGIRILSSSEIPQIRLHILAEQGGLCPICYKPAVRACLDHSHIKRIRGTGLVRGVLCNHCNVFLSKSENNALRYGIAQKDLPDVLRGMADYLEREHYPYLHPSERPKEPRVTKRCYRTLYRMWAKNSLDDRTPPSYGRGKLTKKLRQWFDEYVVEIDYYPTKAK
jgi:recombination endonuclease VII